MPQGQGREGEALELAKADQKAPPCIRGILVVRQRQGGEKKKNRLKSQRNVIGKERQGSRWPGSAPRRRETPKAAWKGFMRKVKDAGRVGEKGRREVLQENPTEKSKDEKWERKADKINTPSRTGGRRRNRGTNWGTLRR